jgi:hypothetical protein
MAACLQLMKTFNTILICPVQDIELVFIHYFLRDQRLLEPSIRRTFQNPFETLIADSQ